ncbi:MAG: hypothetical protein QXV82_09580 [Ignisphaera sp.]
MNKPLECIILSKILDKLPLCIENCSAIETPSYVDGSVPKGCLIAHLTLTLIEMQHISSYFRIPLYNLFAHYNMQSTKNCFNMNVDYCWEVMLASSLLHDLGKLVDQYVARQVAGQSRILHHQVSAVIAKKTLENIVNESIALGVSYSILFHHEAMDWAAIEKSLLHFSYIQKALLPTQNIIYSLSENRLNKFKQNICNILDQLLDKHLLIRSQHQELISVLNCAIQKLMDNQKVPINLARELSVAKIKDPRYLTPALALYRLLYLADNRAASAREQYWLELIQEVDWKHIEDIAWQIISRLARRYRYIGLSSIPVVSRMDEQFKPCL